MPLPIHGGRACHTRRIVRVAHAVGLAVGFAVAFAVAFAIGGSGSSAWAQTPPTAAAAEVAVPSAPCIPGEHEVELDSRTSFGVLSGRRITAVHVTTAAPDVDAPGRAWLGRLRATTLERTVSRQLLFAAGDTVDTLRVGETVRRLRDERIFSDVVLTAWTCEPIGGVPFVPDSAAAGQSMPGVDLTVHTRDAWTLRPTARVVPPAAVTLGLEDRDILGTGKTIGLSELESSAGRGGSVTLSDPWLFGSPFLGAVRLADLGRLHQFSATVRTNASTAFEPWVMEAVVSKWVRENKTRDSTTVSVGTSFRVGRIVQASPDGISRLYVGGELDSLADVSSDSGTVMSRRRYLGADLGFQRQSTQYDTLSWLVQGRGILDIPLGTEGDGLVSVGRNSAALGAPWAGRYDAWVGRIWLPRRGSLLSADAWTSAFVGGQLLSDRVGRIAGAAYQDAANGFWGARFIHEELDEAELDVRIRALVAESTDPTVGVVPRTLRNARKTSALSVERSFHILSVGAASVVDAAVFGAASYRSGYATDSIPYAEINVIGARIRLLSANGGITSVRLDCAYPVGLTTALRRQPFVSLTAGSLFDTGRQRDGTRR